MLLYKSLSIIKRVTLILDKDILKTCITHYFYHTFLIVAKSGEEPANV